MRMTVADLRSALAEMDADREVLITFGGEFVPVVGVTAKPGLSFVLVRGMNKGELPKRFTINEDGLIGHLSTGGMDDNGIAEILGRSHDAVKRRRKALGY